VLSVPAYATWLLALVFLPVVIGLVVFLFAEGDDAGNRFEHHSGDEDDPPDSAEGDVLLAA
jgi:hypothetical protein